MTLHMTSQAPHAIRTVLALVSGLPEQNIRVKTHDIGGGFGGKVPVYPGYVLAVVASLTVGKPVKWIEDRSENLQADSFARDYHIHAELGATKDGKITALKVKTIADHGYTDAAADPSKFPAGLFNVITGSYDFKDAFVEVDGVYTNKPPGGVAYRCSFRVTEAVHAIERMVDILAHDIGKDPAQLRMENFIQPEQFPYKTPTGWEYDSGNYPRGAPEGARHDRLRRPAQGAAREARQGRADGHRHQLVHRDRRAPGPRTTSTSSASRCSTRARSGSIRPARSWPGSGSRPRARATRRRSPRSSPRSSASRSPTSRSSTATRTPRRMAWAPTPRARRRSPARPRRWPPARSGTRRASSPPTCSRPAKDDLEWTNGKFSVKGSPDQSKTIQEIAFAAYTNHPAGDGGRPRGGRLLRPAQPDLPVRQLHLRGRHRQGHRPGHRPPLRGGRRLRQHHQSDDRRRPDPRRPDDGLRPGAVRGDHLRRAGQQPGRHVHGLPPADGRGDARPGRPPRRSPPRRTIRSGPRASASRPRSARHRRSPTPWSTRCGTSACATSTSR